MTSRACMGDELAAITAWVMPPFPEHAADLALLFGTRHGVPAFCAAMRRGVGLASQAAFGPTCR